MSSERRQAAGGRRAVRNKRLVLRATSLERRACRVVARAKGYNEKAGATLLRDYSLADIVSEYERLMARVAAS